MTNKAFFDKKKPVPVILGAGINGLGVIRSFGEEGIASIVLNDEKDIAFHSKYVRGFLCPNPTTDANNFIKFLQSFGANLPGMGFLIATNDRFMIAVSKAQKMLEDHYIFPMSRWEVIDSLIDKKKLYALADRFQIPTPKTANCDNVANCQKIIDELGFPCIIKPSITIGFKETFGKKALIIQNQEELKPFLRKAENSQFSEKSMIIQEYIPGGMDQLYTLTSYANKRSEIKGFSIGHKIRQNPPEAGTIISGRIKHVPEILELGKRLISASGFYGISNIEFKCDARDNSFKLMEINPRTGVWNYSAKASGINLPLLAYKDALGDEFNSTDKPGREIVWLITIIDFYHALFGFKRRGYKKYALTLQQWLQSVKGEKVDAVYNSRDIRPFIGFLLENLNIKKCISKPC